MPESHWDLVFDLHGVLADVNAVNLNYGTYLKKILEPTGIKREKIVEIHEHAFKNWITEITKLTNDYDEDENTNSEVFMKKYTLVDAKWENFILNTIPFEHKIAIKPLLETSLIEYEALAKGPYPILYPEVKSVLTEIVEIGHLRMHIASSASSRHVKGAVVRHNLENFFYKLIGYDTVKAPKKARNADYFTRMLQVIGTVPERIIFVGDSIEEANLTTQLGMKFVLVKRKKDFESTEISKNNLEVINDLNALLPIINTVLNS
ncbi:MAG: HAD family hydrolase [Candidatus Heimdallarchaeota archaeon]|nr:MAG: HAD family hydrolase [Candidatus Heimdallarchaeota archaeon]